MKQPNSTERERVYRTDYRERLRGENRRDGIVMYVPGLPA